MMWLRFSLLSYESIDWWSKILKWAHIFIYFFKRFGIVILSRSRFRRFKVLLLSLIHHVFHWTMIHNLIKKWTNCTRFEICWLFLSIFELGRIYNGVLSGPHLNCWKINKSLCCVPAPNSSFRINVFWYHRLVKTRSWS